MFNISIAQISVWTWSNALYNYRGNQINIVQITILQLLFTNQMLVFDERGNRSTRGKTSHDRVEDQQTQSTYDTECENRTRATLVEGKCHHKKFIPELTFNPELALNPFLRLNAPKTWVDQSRFSKGKTLLFWRQLKLTWKALKSGNQINNMKHFVPSSF